MKMKESQVNEKTSLTSNRKLLNIGYVVKERISQYSVWAIFNVNDRTMKMKET